MEISSIHIAAEVGDVSMVKYFYDTGISVDDREDEHWNCTPLHRAAEKGHFKVAVFLISKKCDINAQDDFGTTALMVALLHRRSDIVELLVDVGADLKVRDADDGNALSYAIFSACPRFVEAIVANDPDIDSRDYFGSTALMHSVCFGEDCVDKDERITVVEILIQSGADVRLSDINRFTLLHHASQGGCLASVKAIIDRSQDLDAETAKGKTALMLATEEGKTNIAEFLLQCGANPYFEDWESRTAFFQAVELHNLELLSIFINWGYSIDCKEYRLMSDTPLVKENILNNNELCTRAIINRFNNIYLPALYQILYLVDILPSMKNLKIQNFNTVAREVEKLVDHDIQTNMFCNIVEIAPLPLKLLVVRKLYDIFCSSFKTCDIFCNSTSKTLNIRKQI